MAQKLFISRYGTAIAQNLVTFGLLTLLLPFNLGMILVSLVSSILGGKKDLAMPSASFPKGLLKDTASHIASRRASPFALTQTIKFLH